MLLPYHFEINLWRRQDIGELANYIWMPLILYYTEKMFDGRHAFAGLAVSYALMMLSHLPSALLFSICLGCFVIVLLWTRHAWRYLPRFVSAIIVGILLARCILGARAVQRAIRAFGEIVDAVFRFSPLVFSD